MAQCHIMFFGDYPGMISDHLAVLSLQITFFSTCYLKRPSAFYRWNFHRYQMICEYPTDRFISTYRPTDEYVWLWGRSSCPRINSCSLFDSVTINHGYKCYSCSDSEGSLPHSLTSILVLSWDFIRSLWRRSCFDNFGSSCLCCSPVLQKKALRKKAGCCQAGGPTDIMKACREITAGKGEASSARGSGPHGEVIFSPWRSRLQLAIY